MMATEEPSYTTSLCQYFPCLSLLYSVASYILLLFYSTHASLAYTLLVSNFWIT